MPREVGWDPNSHVSDSKAYITISVSEPSVMERLWTEVGSMRVTAVTSVSRPQIAMGKICPQCICY